MLYKENKCSETTGRETSVPSQGGFGPSETEFKKKEINYLKPEKDKDGMYPNKRKKGEVGIKRRKIRQYELCKGYTFIRIFINAEIK